MKPLIFIGQRAFDAVSFASNAPVQWALCCDNSTSAELARREHGVELFSLEAATHVRERWSSNHIDQLMEAMWKLLPKEGAEASVVSYSPSRSLEKLVAQRRIIANQNRQKTFFDNKTISRKLFKRLGLSNPRTHSLTFAQQELQTALGTIDYPSVARKIFSSTGSGTFPVGDRDNAYNQLLQLGFAKGEHMLLEERIDGIPLNINAVALGDAVYVYKPSIQLIGIPECTSLPFGFCGNDYISALGLPPEVLKECFRQTQRIGGFLQRVGYRGLFGVDMIITPQGKVLPCEINPRLQNSTALLHWSHKGALTNPANLHLAAFGQLPIDTTKLSDVPSDTNYAQVIIHAQPQDVGIVSGELTEGRYRISPSGEVAFIEETLKLHRLQQGEFLLCGSPPAPGTVIKPEAALLRIITQEKITQDGFSLTHAAIRSAIPWLKAQLRITSSPSDV